MRPILLILAFSMSLLPLAALAQWQPDGVALCTAANNRYDPKIVSDGAGGAIVTWYDNRVFGNYDIYAQRVDASGVPQWTLDGVALCTAASEQSNPTIVSDGAGGAIVTWRDGRSLERWQVYAQRVNASGVPQWTPDGVLLSLFLRGTYGDPEITADGSGGAIVTWQYNPTEMSGRDDIWAQRVDALGVLQWSAGGVALCTAAYDQYSPTIASDGAGGAIVTWWDGRSGSGTNLDIYAQRVNASGVEQWTLDGVALSTAANNQTYPEIVSDGAEGAIVTWRDRRSGTNDDIYAQRVDANGGPQWTIDGVALCIAASDQNAPTIVADGAGGAIVTWQDDRILGNYDVYAQRVNASGVPQWTVDGVALCTAASDQNAPTIVADGAGGAIVTWHDFRTPAVDIYAQRMDASGVPQWTADGVALCTAAYDQYSPTIASDGAGGAIVTWWDLRSGTNSHIYAQRVTFGGVVSPATAVGEITPAARLAVRPNYPNPFAGVTALDLTLFETSTVSVEVFDVAGRRVRAINLGRLNEGTTPLVFDGADDRGRALPSGVYFVRVKAEGETITRKMVIAR